MVKEIKHVVNSNGCWICTSHCKDGHGYPMLYRNKKRWIMSRWVYTQKHGEIPEGKVIRHSCDNPACINIEHLKLGTRKDNSQDMVKRGRALFGEKNPQAKLTNDDILKIYHDRKRTQLEIGKEYGITQPNVSQLQTGHSWSHTLKKHDITPKGKGTPKGETSGKSKLTEAKVREIRRLYKTGKYSHRQLGKMYCVKHSNIGSIIRKHTWKHVK